jgi:MFS transporter, FHS family, L-fucose permease
MNGFHKKSEADVHVRKNRYLVPLILVTSLFFLWGLAYGLLDVLNKHFQDALTITRTRSALLQSAYFGAYFLMALPAGIYISKKGYKTGIITGLVLYATGAFLFYPAATQSSFEFFLLAVFVLACGLAFLETAANPYVTVLGNPESAATRLNLSQSFNGVGSFIGPVIAANVFFASTDKNSSLDSVKQVYLLIGMIVLVIAVLFTRTPMPEYWEKDKLLIPERSRKSLFSYSHFRGAVIAQFFYVAAQVGIAAFFINYCTEYGSNLSNSGAAYLLSLSLLLFTIGRFIGTAILRKAEAGKLLSVYAVINIILCGVVMIGSGYLSIYSLMAIFFFESIMFPSIFALGLKGLGTKTKKASSFIIMAIVGGAIIPYCMGFVADNYSTALAFIIPLFCFVVVAWYGWFGSRVVEPIHTGEAVDDKLLKVSFPNHTKSKDVRIEE